jgi:hypothetical protein
MLACCLLLLQSNPYHSQAIRLKEAMRHCSIASDIHTCTIHKTLVTTQAVQPTSRRVAHRLWSGAHHSLVTVQSCASCSRKPQQLSQPTGANLPLEKHLCASKAVTHIPLMYTPTRHPHAQPHHLHPAFVHSANLAAFTPARSHQLVQRSNQRLLCGVLRALLLLCCCLL